MELLFSWDARLFFWIHDTLRHPVLDRFFPFLTELKNWTWALALLAVLLVFRGGPGGRRALALLVIAVTVSDQMSSHVIKEWALRPRPFEVFPEVLPLAGAAGLSFPSSHAANIFAGCLFLGLVYRRWLWPLLILGVLVGYSRIYVGVHFPLDVLAGAALGAIIALAFVWLHEKWMRLMILAGEREKTGEQKYGNL